MPYPPKRHQADLGSNPCGCESERNHHDDVICVGLAVADAIYHEYFPVSNESPNYAFGADRRREGTREAHCGGLAWIVLVDIFQGVDARVAVTVRQV